MLDLSLPVCSAASSDLLDKTQTAQKLLKVVIAGLSEDAQSEEVRKVWVLLGSATLGRYFQTMSAAAVAAATRI